ncbi:MAG: YraN family protein [Flavobacteriales bacterium]
MSKDNSKHNKEQGQIGEDLAAKYLTNNGYKIKAKNWRYHPYEIDIIASKEDVVVFVEVKLREDWDLLELWETVSKGQQKRIVTAAHEYLLMNDIEYESRFDIIGVRITRGKVDIEHYEDAFWA